MKRLLVIIALLCTVGLQAMTADERAEADRLRLQLVKKYGLAAGDKFDNLVPPRGPQAPGNAHDIVEKEYLKEAHTGGSGTGGGVSDRVKVTEVQKYVDDELNFYALLGISPSADEAEIKKAYRKKSIQAARANDTPLRQKLNAANEVLTDPKMYSEGSMWFAGTPKTLRQHYHTKWQAKWGGSWTSAPGGTSSSSSSGGAGFAGGGAAGGAYGGGASYAGGFTPKPKKSADNIFNEKWTQFKMQFENFLGVDPSGFDESYFKAEWAAKARDGQDVLKSYPVTWSVGPTGIYGQLKDYINIANYFAGKTTSTEAKQAVRNYPQVNAYYNNVRKGVVQEANDEAAAGNYDEAVRLVRPFTPNTSGLILRFYKQQAERLKATNIDAAIAAANRGIALYPTLKAETTPFGSVFVNQLDTDYSQLRIFKQALESQKTAERMAREEAERRAREDAQRRAREQAQRDAERRAREEAERKRQREEARRAGTTAGAAAAGASSKQPEPTDIELEMRRQQRKEGAAGAPQSAADIKSQFDALDDLMSEW